MPAQRHTASAGRRRRRRRLLKWNGNYARGIQGICKTFCMVATLLALIIIGSSPYGRPLYVREGVTWPFHLVMFLTVTSWLLFTAAYLFFTTGACCYLNPNMFIRYACNTDEKVFLRIEKVFFKFSVPMMCIVGYL